MDTVVDSVKQIISDILEVETDLLNDVNQKINEITDVDSIQVLDMVTAIEKKFKVNIGEEDYSKLGTINSVASLVVSKKTISAS